VERESPDLAVEILSVPRGDEPNEAWQFDRLSQVVHAATSIAEVFTGRPLPKGTVRRLEEHEGELRIVWKADKPEYRKCFEAAWRIEKEAAIVHLTTEEYNRQFGRR
jgi:hypothetical protein